MFLSAGIINNNWPGCMGHPGGAQNTVSAVEEDALRIIILRTDCLPITEVPTTLYTGEA